MIKASSSFQFFNINRYIAIGLVIAFLISSCSSSTTQPSEPVAGTLEITDSAPAVTETPTESPTATITQQVILFFTPPGSDPDLVTTIEQRLMELAEIDNLVLQVVSELASSDISPEVQLVVVLPPDSGPDPGIRALASAVPDTQFLALGIPGLEPGSNLSVIGARGENFDQQGFLAGYLAATVTPEWRVGVINTTGVPSEIAGDAFLNGVVFFCGLCRPVNPPYFEYPLIYNLPAGAGTAEQALAVEFMVANAVQTVYLTPGALTADQVSSLAGAGINIIGSEDPPAGVNANWIATVEADWLTPLEEVWNGLLAGEAGVALDVDLVINDRNQELFSQGRQGFVDEILSDLQSGYIDTGVNTSIENTP